MRQKYLEKAFGICPRALCKGTKLLPVGLSSRLNEQRVKVLCVCCQEVYLPDNALLNDLDGAYFGGPSMPNILMKTFPDLYPNNGPTTYIPRIYGFKIFGGPGSKYEYKYDYKTGKCLNFKEMQKFLIKPKVKKPEPIQKEPEYICKEQDIEFEKKYG
jgi:hypothetical protein